MKLVKNGTIVKVKSGLESRYYGHNLWFAGSMLEYCGQELEVYNSRVEENENRFELKGATGWTFNLEMIEEVCEEDMIEQEEVCAICGEIVNEDSRTWVERDRQYVCENCLEEHYTQCDDCGEYERNDYLTTTARGNVVCEDCRDNHYTYCYNCNEYYEEGEVIYDDSTDEYYCEECYDRLSRGRVYGYHEFRDWEFFKASDEEQPPRYIGFELEVENPNYDDYCKEYIYDNLNAVLMHDGSLNTGYEIVSHPQSFKRIQEDENIYRDVFEKLSRNGYKSHDTSTCGLHFHVSKPLQEEINALGWDDEDCKKRDELRGQQDDIIDRIILVMETYKEELIRFSRRTSSNLSRWAKFMSDKQSTKEGIKSLYYIKKHKDTCDRYQALNLTNSNTIEFRIFRGTLKYETFMASVELVNNIVSLCSDLKTPITDITWDKLINSKYARKYCEDRGIITDRVIVDNSALEIEFEKQVKKIAKQVSKYILSIYNNEVKIATRGLRINLNSDRDTTRHSIQHNYTMACRLRDYANEINDYVDRLTRDNVTSDDVKYVIQQMSNCWTTLGEHIDWNNYSDIKEKLDEILSKLV